ncbi:DUF1205 domain-containing protein [Actinomadura sp. KC345]|uniref:nucleotide disphospho-sugar-binding domain-containing protein n=1 Tax=Actinomadura sp. KC345 TaxID=2530371 RepID=UPI0010501587|nr:nucleotide disphospho-sugar-binding domain-containing protein [Actinomadura sp. KC345]TDC41955.1 DUF1205 domain-containing protein [Actinomadura sp. KC345]
MRALFVASPGLGHLFPTVPLAQALRAAGHDVRYATGGLSVAASDAGFTVVDATPGLDYLKVYMPDDTSAEEDGDPVDGNPMFAEDPEDAQLARLFARVSGVMVDGVLEAARSWSPDLVVAPPLQGAGALAASALGLPLAELRLGSYDSGSGLRAMLREAMDADYERHGVTGAPAATAPISVLPPSFTALLPPERRSRDAWPMRHVPYNGGAVLPGWLLERPARPRIAVTLGTIEAQWGGIAVLRPLIAAAGGVDAEFVVTLGGGDATLLGPLPDNVRTVEWAPLDALLESCAAIVHHGGSGTTMTAVAAGIPQCVLPRGSYQQTGGEVIPRRGIGLIADADSIGAAECQALLKDEGMRDAAEQAREELRSMPSPAELVPELVGFAG